MGWETFQFGRLCLDAAPQHVPAIPTVNGDVPDYKEGQEINIMDAPKKDSITWVKPDGMNLFVADRVLLKNVSWDDLDRKGFVQGKEICVGGRRYCCELLQVGCNRVEQNEWDNFLDVTTENDDIWHWGHMFFWGIDTSRSLTSNRAVRGYRSARSWDNGNATSRYANVGFRPMLEPLPSDVLKDDKVIALEGQDFVLSQLQGAKDGMFYPQLTSIGTSPFAGIPYGETIKMYTVLSNGNPVRTDLDKPELISQDASIVFTDVFYGEEYLISWVITNGIAIASRPLFKNYS